MPLRVSIEGSKWRKRPLLTAPLGLSWGFTAGASYRNPQVHASLTLGGYDTRRFEGKVLANIPFGSDISKDLVVRLQAISYDTIGSSPLLTDSVYVFIDSLVTHLWLPLEVCQAFERAFNLTWNSSAELYLIDEHVHQTLVSQNPTFTFTLASTNDSSQNVDIALPYAAFDLHVSEPIVSGAPQRYFPLKQAQNSSQYILGRVFLQEAYVIADYERRIFSVAQAVAGGQPGQDEWHLVGILPPGAEEPVPTSSELSGGAIAGIVVGVVVLLVMCAGLLIYLWRRRAAGNRKAAEEKASDDRNEKADEQQSRTLLPPPELDSQEASRYEMDHGEGVRQELPSDYKAGKKGGLALDGRRHEMDTLEVAAVELEASEAPPK